MKTYKLEKHCENIKNVKRFGNFGTWLLTIYQYIKHRYAFVGLISIRPNFTVRGLFLIILNK
jgi:hypothetical protein